MIVKRKIQMKQKQRKIRTAKIIITLILILVVFFIGWMQLFVKSGNIGVMTSKTSGLCNKPIENGKFTWKIENILPTNVHIEQYKIESYRSRQTISGYLPSAELYSTLFSSKGDFSYKVDMNVTLTITPQGIVELTRQNKITNQESLYEYVDIVAKDVCSIVAQYLISEEFSNKLELTELVKVVDEEKVKELLANNPKFEYIQVSDIEIINAKLPDLRLYHTIKSNYDSYVAKILAKMEQNADAQAVKMQEEERLIKQLERFGDLLKEYPELSDICKNGDIDAILKALKTYR